MGCPTLLSLPVAINPASAAWIQNETKDGFSKVSRPVVVIIKKMMTYMSEQFFLK